MSSSLIVVQMNELNEDISDEEDLSKKCKDETIDFYHISLKRLDQKLKKVREQILYYRKIQTQFSLLLNKVVEAQYGKIINDPPIKKPLIAPLPPIQKITQKEIIRMFHTTSPQEMAKFIQNSSLIEQLIFTDSTIFDDIFLDNLMRVSPDVRVSFFTNTILQLKHCGFVIDQLLPIMSSTAENSSLQDMLKSSDPDTNKFFSFYLQTLKTLSNIIGYEVCKIVYSCKGNLLLYPQLTFNNIFPINNSLCGTLLNQKDDITILHDPDHHKKFDHINEAPIFEDYHHAMSFRLFSPSEKGNFGIIIILSNKQFSNTDETILQLIGNYTCPIFHLFRSVFIHIAPSHFDLLSGSIAKLRMVSNIFPALNEEICKLAGCQKSRVLLTEKDNNFPDLPVLPEGKSLINDAVKTGKIISLRNPRKLSAFNKAVDDDSSLGKITSMLISPIPKTHLVIVLYNSITGSEFNPIQKTLTESFGYSLPPVLFRTTMRKKVEQFRINSDNNDQALNYSLEIMKPITEAIKKGNLFNFIKEKIPKNVQCYLFLFLSDDDVIRFPDGRVFTATNNLKTIYQAQTLTKNFDIDIECGGDINTKAIMIVPSHSGGRVICIFTTDDLSTFTNQNTEFLCQFANDLLLVTPWYHLEFETLNSINYSINLHDAIRCSISSFNNIIDANVDLILDKNDVNSNFSVPIITSDNTEGALVCQDPNIDTNQQNMISEYSKWLSTIFSLRKAPEDHQEFISVFEKLNIYQLLKITPKQFEMWISSIALLYSSNNIKFAWRANAIQVIIDLINTHTLKPFLKDKMLLMISFIIMLQDIEKIWECKTDSKTLHLVKSIFDDSSVEPLVCPYLAALFGTRFGIIDSGDINYEEKVEFGRILKDFVVEHKITFYSAVLSHSRCFSLHGYPNKGDNYIWLGRALVILSNIEPLIRNTESSAENLKEIYGESVVKSELFKAERIYSPLLSLFIPKNPTFQKMAITLREGIKEAWKAIRASTNESHMPNVSSSSI